MAVLQTSIASKSDCMAAGLVFYEPMVGKFRFPDGPQSVVVCCVRRRGVGACLGNGNEPRGTGGKAKSGRVASVRIMRQPLWLNYLALMAAAFTDVS